MFIAFFSSLAGLSPENRTINIKKANSINPYEIVFNAVAEVESNSDPQAVNQIEQAYGIVQVRQIRLKDFKKRTGIDYKLTDMYSIENSKRVFFYYCRLYGESNIELMIRKWNGSGRQTYEYLAKVKKHLSDK
jgi:hypothetical protein